MIGRRGSIAVVGLVIFDAIFGSNAPSPLYVIYQQKFHFSALVVSGIYAVYAIGIVLSLLLTGPLSDQIGRRPVLLLATALIFVGGCVFLFATDTAMLFIARCIQGMATGAMASSSAAAMADLARPGERQRASLITTLSFTAGAALGTLSAGVMAQYLPDPLVLPFALLLVLTAATMVGLVLVPEPSRNPTAAKWSVQRPGVPSPLSALFFCAALVLVVSWGIGGVYSGLCASMTRTLLHISNHAFAGFMLFTFNIVGASAQLALRGRNPRALMTIGASVSAIGVGCIELAVGLHLASVFLIATVLAGAGSSLAFVGSLARMNDIAPPQQRAEVLAAFNLIGYLGLSLPVLGIGLLTTVIGLGGATAVFSAVVAGLAIAGLLLVRTRRFGNAGGLVVPQIAGDAASPIGVSN